MLNYLRVEWHHRYLNEPVLMFSEICDGIEVRKIEIYRDGRMDYADRVKESGSTHLSATPMPPIEEIAAKPEFSPAEIEPDEFEALWQKATRT